MTTSLSHPGFPAGPQLGGPGWPLAPDVECAARSDVPVLIAGEREADTTLRWPA